MKVLSIKQPWAWLIVNGFKDIENRTWETKFRGAFLIHAGKTLDSAGYDFVKDTFPEINLPDKRDFWKGGIVGGAVLIDCVQESESRWFFGPFGFVLQDAKHASFHPLRGQLGFFNF